MQADIVIEDTTDDTANQERYIGGALQFGAAAGGQRGLTIVSGAPTSRTSGTADAAVTYSATTLTDTRKDFIALGVIAGDIIFTSGGSKGVVGSVAATVLTLDANGWKYGTPANGTGYNVYVKDTLTFKWRLTDFTTPSDSASVVASFWKTTPYVIDWKFKPASGAVENKLTVDNALVINTTTGGTENPATTKIRILVAGSYISKLSSWKGATYLFNGKVYDNLTQTDVDAYPLAYDADVLNRIMVTYNKPKAGGAERYDAWTKSTGTDAAALIDEIRNVDKTDYTQGTASATDKQAWDYEALASADYPINSYDTIYTVQSVGQALETNGTVQDLIVKHSDGVANDDAGRHSGKTATNVRAPLWYCAALAPDGGPWTFAKAEACQTVVENPDALTTRMVYGAGRLICFKKGTAPSTRRRYAAVI